MNTTSSLLVPCILKSQRTNRRIYANACAISPSLAWLTPHTCWVPQHTGSAIQIRAIVKQQGTLQVRTAGFVPMRQCSSAHANVDACGAAFAEYLQQAVISQVCRVMRQTMFTQVVQTRANGLAADACGQYPEQSLCLHSM